MREVPAYAELHCKTNFSFLQAASHPDEFARQAAELEYAALAITDRNSLAGVVRAHAAAKETNLKLLIGAEITPEDAPLVVLLATDRAAYGRLSRLITIGRRREKKGHCRLTLDAVASHAEGLIAAVPLASMISLGKAVSHDGLAVESPTGCFQSPAIPLRPEPDGFLARGSDVSGRETQATVLRWRGQSQATPGAYWLARYREAFGDRCYALAELHRGPDDRLMLEKMSRAAQVAGVPLAAANDVLHHHPSRRPLQDVLTAIRAGRSVAECGRLLLPNAERCLKSRERLAQDFAPRPDLLERTLEVAAACSFSLDELRYEYPEELCPQGTTPTEYLKQLTWRGAAERYPRGVPDKVRRTLEHELGLIEELRYAAYFLTVWDLVRFARERNILCQGRGSAANSAVCYCLGVTSVDPERIDLLFERFISRERDEAPDIDVD
ncbi:MAG: PHP domain-containing protein, partial [Planctomycetales bacterium]